VSLIFIINYSKDFRSTVPRDPWATAVFEARPAAGISAP